MEFIIFKDNKKIIILNCECEKKDFVKKNKKKKERKNVILCKTTNDTNSAW